jgi:hypothetical protein
MNGKRRPARAAVPRALSSGDAADACRGTCSEFLMSFMTSALGCDFSRPTQHTTDARAEGVLHGT